MNLRRIFSLAAAIAAVATAAAVCVVAAAFAVYALAKIWLGAAGASAVVAGVFALIAVIVAYVATRKATPRTKPGAPPADEPLINRLIDIAKQRPLIALGATAAAATVLIRNPAIVSAVVSAFLAGNATRPEK